MKKIFLFLALSLSCHLALASSLEGTYKVVKGCNPNNLRLGVLSLMNEEGLDIDINLNQEKNIISFSSYRGDFLAMPLSAESQLEPIIFKRYYKNAEIQLTDSSYAFTTKGKEIKKCDNYPLPGSHPCLGTWNDEINLQVNKMGKLKVQWHIEDSSGTCLLERQ